MLCRIQTLERKTGIKPAAALEGNLLGKGVRQAGGSGGRRFQFPGLATGWMGCRPSRQGRQEEEQGWVGKGASSLLGQLNLRCLGEVEVEVEMPIRHWDAAPGVRKARAG